MEYRIKPPGTTCRATGEPLEPGSVCRSALVEVDGKQLRYDYSPKAWPGPPEGTLGHWLCRIPEAKGNAILTDPDELMQRFEQLDDDGGHEVQQQLRYALALMLIRAKRLVLDETTIEDERVILHLAGVRGEGTFLVPDLQLPTAQIAELQKQLTTAAPVAEAEEVTAA